MVSKFYRCFATVLTITNITAVNYVPILKVKDYRPVRALKNLFFTILFDVDGSYLQVQFKW